MSTATELKAAERTVVGFNGSFSTPRMKSRSAHKRHRVRRPVKAERQYLGKTELIETRDKRFKKGSGFRRAIARVFPSRAKLQAEAIRMWTASKNAMLNEYDDLNGLFNRFVRKRLMLDLRKRRKERGRRKRKGRRRKERRKGGCC